MTEDDKPAPVRLEPKQKIIFGVIGVVLLALLGRWVYTAFILSDEDKVRAVIAEMAAAASDRNPRGVVGTMAQDFEAGWKGYAADRNDVRQALIRLWMTMYKGGCEVTVHPDEVPVKVAPDGKTATARFQLTVRGKRSPEGEWEDIIANEVGRQVSFDAAFKNGDDGWQFTSIELVSPKPEDE